jgi:hypothetical protein
MRDKLIQNLKRRKNKLRKLLQERHYNRIVSLAQLLGDKHLVLDRVK